MFLNLLKLFLTEIFRGWLYPLMLIGLTFWVSSWFAFPQTKLGALLEYYIHFLCSALAIAVPASVFEGVWKGYRGHAIIGKTLFFGLPKASIVLLIWYVIFGVGYHMYFSRPLVNPGVTQVANSLLKASTITLLLSVTRWIIHLRVAYMTIPIYEYVNVLRSKGYSTKEINLRLERAAHEGWYEPSDLKIYIKKTH